MDILFGIIIGVIVLTLLVVAHELGHALVSRRNGIVVEEFGIGFPPKAWSKKLKHSLLGKNVEYSVNWLPLGGFVKLQGEHDAAHGKGDYGAATFWQKTKILLAGVAMNWLVAAVLLSLLALFGMPKILPNQFVIPSDVDEKRGSVQIVYVEKDSPADKAGLKVGDELLRFAGEELPKAESLSEKTKANKGKTVEVIYSRDNMEKIAKVTLNAENTGNKGYMGVGPDQRVSLRSSWSAPIVGPVVAAQLTGATFQGLGDIVVNAVKGMFLQFSPDKATSEAAKKDLAVAGESVTGPVGIFGQIFPAASKAGLTQVLLLSAIISLSLAVMNALPIPALDGGRWFVTALYKLMKKPLTKETEEKIHSIGFMVLMALVLVVTFSDVLKLFK